MREIDFINQITKRADIRLFFIFGQDESAIANIATQMAQQLPSDSEAVDLDSAKLRGDPALLSDEAASTSLFGGSRYIRLHFAREEGVDAIENLLNAEQAGNPVIATAGDLKKTSKLRKLVESHPLAAAQICYLPTESEAAQLIMVAAQAEGLKLDRALAQRIAHYTGQDRRLAASEIQKLALYYDAAPDRPAQVDADIFKALSAETNEEDVGALVNQVMGGEIKAMGAELVSARVLGLEPIRIIRALQRRVAQLMGMRAKVEGGLSPAQVVESNRAIFWKERDAYKQQLSRWPAARLAGLNAHLLEVERNMMATKADIGAVILEQELSRMARAAARAR